MFCTQCGEPLPSGRAVCPKCGFWKSSPIEFFIPDNTRALLSYYLGIFSFLLGPLAFLLGIPALLLGIGGLMYARKHVQARGAIHAWVGILTGTLSALMSLTVIAIVVVGIYNT